MNVSVPLRLRRASVLLVVPPLYVAVQSLLVGYELWHSPVPALLEEAGSQSMYYAALVCAILALVAVSLALARRVYGWSMETPRRTTDRRQR